MSARELIEKEAAKLPEALQRELCDFARFLRLKEAEANRWPAFEERHGGKSNEFVERCGGYAKM